MSTTRSTKHPTTSFWSGVAGAAGFALVLGFGVVALTGMSTGPQPAHAQAKQVSPSSSPSAEAEAVEPMVVVNLYNADEGGAHRPDAKPSAPASPAGSLFDSD